MAWPLLLTAVYHRVFSANVQRTVLQVTPYAAILPSPSSFFASSESIFEAQTQVKLAPKNPNDPQMTFLFYKYLINSSLSLNI